MSKKPIFIRNKRRALFDKIGRSELYVPQYEQLNMSPIQPVDVSEDFMNEKRRRPPIGSRKPPVLGSGSGPRAPEGPLPPQRFRGVVQHQDQSWLPPNQERPAQMVERDFSHGNVGYDDVPDPPPKFEHTHPPLGVDLSNLHEGQYCLIYEGQVWPSDQLEPIEAAIEEMMRADPNLQESDLIVIQRMSLKVGVHVD